MQTESKLGDFLTYFDGGQDLENNRVRLRFRVVRDLFVPVHSNPRVSCAFYTAQCRPYFQKNPGGDYLALFLISWLGKNEALSMHTCNQGRADAVALNPYIDWMAILSLVQIMDTDYAKPLIVIRKIRGSVFSEWERLYSGPSIAV